MPSLADTQRAFAEALRDPARDTPAAARVNGAAADRRFNVYRNNMVASLVNALASSFPAVRRLVGEEYFAAAARAFVDRHPPDSPVLLCYGRAFGDFLSQRPSAAGVPYLGDVARLEWARLHALHAADAEPAGIQALAVIPEAAMDSVTVSLHPSLSVLGSRWPVVSLWRANVDPEDAGEVDMHTGENAVVVRPALQVGVHALSPGARGLIEDLRDGSTLGAAAGAAVEAHPDFDLAAQLRFVFEIGAVTAVNIREPEDQP